MLSLRVLQGHPSQTFNLKEGINTVGRQIDCDISLGVQGVSKVHAQLLVKDSICSVTDLGSSNGTFVNGVKVQDRILQVGDRIAFHSVIVELISQAGVHSQIPEVMPNIHAHPSPHVSSPEPQGTGASIENLIMPGFYKMNELYPTKNIIAGFILFFALTVTFLSTIPMTELMKSSIQKEASRRALTVARQLADAAEKALAMSADTAIRTDYAESEDGVIAALVVAKEDGHIIAPLSKAQSYSSDEFVARARKHDDIFIDQTGPSSLGVSVPVRLYSPETGQLLVVANAAVSYKLSSLDWSSVVGLFARVVIFALLFAYVLYIVIYKMITQPIRHAHIQLDQVLKGELSLIDMKYEFGTLKRFVQDVNSALSRVHSPTSQNSLEMDIDTSQEGANLLRILKDAAICVSREGKIISVNSAYEELTHQRQLTLEQQDLNAINDQSLKLTLEELWQKAMSTPQTIATTQLDISGQEYELDGQALTNGKSVQFIVITLKPRVAA